MSAVPVFRHEAAEGWQPYANVHGGSGVVAYLAGEHSLRVRFADGAIYRYTEVSAGPEHLESMRLLARAGRGLATYINQHQPEHVRA